MPGILGDPSEIRIRAERRLGEMIRTQKETVGLGQGRRTDIVPKENYVEKPTLSDAGISKKLSSRSQAIARIPDAWAILGRRYNRIKKAVGRPDKCGQNVHIKPARTAERVAKSEQAFTRCRGSWARSCSRNDRGVSMYNWRIVNLSYARARTP